MFLSSEYANVCAHRRARRHVKQRCVFVGRGFQGVADKALSADKTLEDAALMQLNNLGVV